MVAQDFMDLVTRPDGSPDPQRFQELWPQIRVLARCSPVHKHDIVRKLHVRLLVPQPWSLNAPAVLPVCRFPSRALRTLFLSKLLSWFL